MPSRPEAISRIRGPSIQVQGQPTINSATITSQFRTTRLPSRTLRDSRPTTTFPAPGIDRNSFPVPDYRNVDLTVAKAFGLPNARILGEHAQIEFKANMFNVFNLLNINPTTISTNVANSNLGQASGALGSRTIDFQARFNF